MILHIGKEFKKQMTKNTCDLSLEMLNIQATHMFIASNPWEEIHIEIDDETKADNLKFLPSICKNIKVSLPDSITINTIGLLSKLYPDKASMLRRAFMSGGDVKGVLSRCLV